MLSLPYLEVRAQQYIHCKLEVHVLSQENLSKTLLKIWLNPGLDLTILPGTGPADFYISKLIEYAN